MPSFSSRSAYVRTAISSKRMLRFTYEGKRRTCEPHVLGVTNGQEQVLCWQESGGSSRGGIPEWRRFNLNEMENIVITRQTFPGKRLVPHPHSKWDRVIITVS